MRTALEVATYIYTVFAVGMIVRDIRQGKG